MAYLSNSTTLMVASDKLHTVRVAQLETGEEGDGLYAKEATVHIVS